jgi:hypothetical protein
MNNKIVFAAVAITSIAFCSPAYATNPFPGVNYGDWISGYHWTDHYDQISNSWTTMNTKSCPAHSDVDFQSQTMLTTSDGAPIGHEDTFGCRNRYDPANDINPTPSAIPTISPSIIPSPTASPNNTANPSTSPTVAPSIVPTVEPSMSASPTVTPSATPTQSQPNTDIVIDSRYSKISLNNVSGIKIATVQNNKLYYLVCSSVANVKNTNRVVATNCTKTYVKNIKNNRL